MLKVFIVDDEAPARRELKYLLGQIEGVEIIGEASNGNTALKNILSNPPQVVFLDIHMPSLNGLDLSRLIGKMPDSPLMIFATAYEEYGVKAFDVDAFDYILKPFTPERVQKSIAKVRKYLTRTTAQPVAEHAPPHGALTAQQLKIPLYKGDKIIPTTPKNIIFARSEEGVIIVHTQEGKFTTRLTLSDLETKLLPHGFIRSHRSALVNSNHIREVIPWFNGSYKLVMGDRERTEILVSRYNAKDLKAALNL
jgi:DNA-binding LytR/AlgR family response regulator